MIAVQQFLAESMLWPPQENIPAPAPAAWSTPTTSHPVVAPAAALEPQISLVTCSSHPSMVVSVQREPIWKTLGSVSHLRLVPVMTKAQ